MAEISSRVDEIAISGAAQPEKTAQLQALLAPLTTPSSLPPFLSAVLANLEALGLVVMRPVVASYVSHVVSLSAEASDRERIFSTTIQALQPVLVSFEDQDAIVREALAGLFESQARGRQAATILLGIRLDSGQRVISDGYRVAILIRILRNILDDLDVPALAKQTASEAEDLISKIAPLLVSSEDQAAKSQFKLAQAKVFEARRKFLEASARYYEISHGSSSASGATTASDPTVDADDRLILLSAAVSCALLAPAGPARGRMLSLLSKDERLLFDPSTPSQLPSEQDMLDNLLFERLLPASKVQRYLASVRRPIPQIHLLPPESIPPPTTTSTTSTAIITNYAPDSVLDRAVTEHNLLAASKLYLNISFSELADLLGLESPKAAEGYAAKMIQERRLRAIIDRVDKVIFFRSSSSSIDQSQSISLFDAESERIKASNDQILGICLQVENVVALIRDKSATAV
ncbi:uncharacterized protein V1516DRAFT_668654 [Lipomyces oligophaga]|uniref:uncharacterized protein n=1 Tax=Lipomyces oligophaga TaxID=45792 RepID=UPI0034CD09BA